MTDLAKKIASDATALGIKKGDTLLVHSSLRSLGGATPQDVIDGLLLALGDEGTLVFPTLRYLRALSTRWSILHPSIFRHTVLRSRRVPPSMQ